MMTTALARIKIHKTASFARVSNLVSLTSDDVWQYYVTLYDCSVLHTATD